jgi:hypothetical protein
MKITQWLACYLSMLFIAPIAAQEQTKTVITPPDVYNFSIKLSHTLKKISNAMGVEHQARQPIGVKNVSPREVYFQAATLYIKTSRLMFEFTNDEAKKIKQLKVDAHPADVLALLQLAEDNLETVIEKLNIPPSDSIKVLDQNITPTQVFQTIVELNRRTNDLLDFRFSPSNVHQKITEAITVAAAVLESKKGAKLVFYPNPLERNIRPKDVYTKMVIMYDAMNPIMEKFGKKCLELEEYEKDRPQVLPSDVYDLAVMMVSQLRYMHSLIPGAKKIKNSYYPGKVIPADVYQRLTILEKQMTEMMRVHHIMMPTNDKKIPVKKSL